MTADLSSGQAFGPYHIAGTAGAGGMGVVYRAEQRSLARVVALKVIRPDIAQSGDYRSRFLREARLAAAVDHPHVVSVFDVGEQAGRLYLTMQWVDGQDLRTLLDRQRRLDPDRTVLIGTQLAGALQAVHEAGLVHRDVKPSNVLMRDLGGRDHAYLTDFGIAKMPGAQDDLTRTGWSVGTPGYLSPEQIRGQRPGPHSDLYALACVLFEALTGRRPFGGENDMVMQWAHLSSPRPVVSAPARTSGAAMTGSSPARSRWTRRSGSRRARRSPTPSRRPTRGGTGRPRPGPARMAGARRRSRPPGRLRRHPGRGPRRRASSTRPGPGGRRALARRAAAAWRRSGARPAGRGSVRTGRVGSAWSGSAQSGSARPGSARPGSAWSGSAQPGRPSRERHRRERHRRERHRREWHRPPRRGPGGLGRVPVRPRPAALLDHRRGPASAGCWCWPGRCCSWPR